MRAHNREVFSLIGELHDRYQLSEVYTQCQLFMADCLRLVEDGLPPVVRAALDVAEKFLGGEASAEQLLVQQRLCWKYLTDRRLAFSFEQQKARRVRATLCVLYPVPSEGGDVYILLEWFMEMFDPEGRFERRTFEIMKSRFY